MQCCGIHSQASRRKALLLRRHPLLGRKLKHSDWQELQGFITKARRLAISRRFRVICLIQGEVEGSDAMEGKLWEGGADVIRLTFKSQRPDALFFPESVLGEGRNALLAAAAAAELRQGCRYTYYCLMDDDLQSDSWALGWHLFSKFLADWEPAVGLPMIKEYEHAGPAPGDFPSDVWNFDHMVVAVHTDAAPSLLPYVTDSDRECAWVSQWRMALLSSAMYPGHVLVSDSWWLWNKYHDSYRKQGCRELMDRASAELRSMVAQTQRSCFPDSVHTVLHIGGRVRISAYLPWSIAKRRTDEESAHGNYSGMTLSQIQSCDDNPTARALNLSHGPQWCQNCDPSVAVWTSQFLLSGSPRTPSTWLQVAEHFASHVDGLVSMKQILGMLGISIRLYRCSGLDMSRLPWTAMPNIIEQSARYGIRLDPTLDTLKLLEQKTVDDSEVLYGIIRSATTEKTEDHLRARHLLSEKKVVELVNFLSTCLSYLPQHNH
eukprot:TRINITY_DN62051_c0_g1_i1.p1 TRINITY_DN62051_c0_g1~~TRINITY_DN62051_c0_g1_i1.p1  ORF type:complete len:490 (+),score=70.53 TRINITY_DN62051_c0_g1_i1:124-1593(+)